MKYKLADLDRYQNIFGDGDLILNEGPGKGFASYPWVLDKYERSLGLSIQESWLIKHFIKFSWDSKGVVNPSVRRISRESIVSRTTIYRIINSLLSKGYIDRVGQINSIYDRRVRYDISGIFNALAYTILLDSQSNYSKKISVQDVSTIFKDADEELLSCDTPAKLNEYLHSVNLKFNWCEFRVEDFDAETKKKFTIECRNCGEAFLSHSKNSLYCDNCKEEGKKTRWENFMEKIKTHEKIIDSH